MKNKIKIIMLFISLIFITSCSRKYISATYTIKVEESNNIKYFIEDITKSSNIYVISLSRNDSVFRVLTNDNPLHSHVISQNHTRTNKKIEVGKQYILELKAYNHVVPNCYENTYASDVEYYITYYFVRIALIDKCEIIYTTKDLDGIYLIE